MAARQRNSCATCGKTAGIFSCRGCSDTFCLRHTNEHREDLERQMNDLIVNHNKLKQSISGETSEQFRQSLMQQIDQWEQQSVDKIHQVATKTRQQLLTTVRDRADQLNEKLTQLTQQLSKARIDGEYFENDLHEWSEKLQQFQQIFREQHRVIVHQDKNSTPFISKISLSEHSSTYMPEPIHHRAYERHRETTSPDTEEVFDDDFRGKGQYSAGQHSLRFVIEDYDANSSILFGIVSKSLHANADAYENPTFYGWTGNNLVYLAGEGHVNHHGYKSDIRNDDVFILMMDCDRPSISLTNERTNRTYDLRVDTTKCPLPWQPNVRFFLNSD